MAARGAGEGPGPRKRSERGRANEMFAFRRRRVNHSICRMNYSGGRRASAATDGQSATGRAKFPRARNNKKRASEELVADTWGLEALAKTQRARAPGLNYPADPVRASMRLPPFPDTSSRTMKDATENAPLLLHVSALFRTSK
jgi:outer membrane biosynthesis protein TonB